MKNNLLKKNNIENAQIKLLAGDASFRKYHRVHKGETTFVIMDAPPDKEDIKPFLHIAEHLYNSDLSAPKIIDFFLEYGLILMEDLGDELYSSVLNKCPNKEEELYSHAIDVLVHIHQRPIPPTPSYYDELFLKEIELFTDWHLNDIAERDKKEFLEMWRFLLPFARTVPDSLVLRDYHADNLIWLPNREKIKKVGLLDFQDAVIGPITYDIISLLEDARRDVSQETVYKMIERYLQKTGINKDDFTLSYSIMAAQRNIKIIGIFNRLCKRDNKPQYLGYLPRVWRYLKKDLEHPVLNNVREWIVKNNCQM